MSNENKKIRAVLTINVTYDSNGESDSYIRLILNRAAEHLANVGLLSEDNSPALVDTWDYNVETKVIDN